MKLQMMLSAVALAAFAGVAHAQNTTGTTGTTTNSGVTSGINNSFVNPFQFVPNAGFVPPGGVVDPFTNSLPTGVAPGFTGTSLGVDPVTGQPITSVGGSLFNGYVPGYATGYYYPFGYNGYYGGYGYPGAVYLGPNVNPNPSAGYSPLLRRPGLPILGVNVPATAIPRTGRARVRQLTPTNNQRLADTDEGVQVVNPANPNPNTLGTRGTGTQVVTTPTPQDFGVVTQVSNMMASDRPLRGGRLMQVNGSDATVEYSMNGQTRTAYVPLNEIFYFRGNGEMASLAQNPRAIRAGGSVMVADPAQPLNPVRQSVAGSRQTYGTMRVTNHTTKKTKKSAKKSRTVHHRTY